MIKKFILLIIFILYGLIINLNGTGLVRTSSNTLLFTEDFNDTTYIDTSSYYSYTFYLGGGYVSQKSHITWDWDGPVADIEYSKDGTGIYIIYEKYNDVPKSGYGMRPDVFLYKIDEYGVKLSGWERSVWVRHRTNVEWGGSRYPSLTTDPDGNVYVVWLDRSYDEATGTYGKHYIAMQKFNSSGKPQWNNGYEIYALTNVYGYQSPRCVYYNGYVYVVAKYNGNPRYIHLQKVNATNGNLMFTNPVIVNADTSTYVYNPDIKVGGNKLYVCWSKNFTEVDIQRLSLTNGSRDFTSDVKVNTNSGYYYKYFWYGNREDDVVMDIDNNTNIYVAWSSGDINSEQQVYLQKLDKDLNRIWTNDIKVPGINETAAAYPAITVDPTGIAVYVAWISHRSGYNDHGYLQKINAADGSKGWAEEINMRNNYGYYHGGRIDFFNGWVYTAGVNGRFQRFNQNGDRFFNGVRGFLDRSYFVRTKFDSLTVIPGVVKEARIIETSVTKNPAGAKVYYRFTGNGNKWSTYQESTNGFINITLTSNIGNDFRYGALLDSKSYVETNDWGTDRDYLYQIQVEATKVYLGDWNVSQYDTGEEAIGNLVINLSAENQSILKYVYNSGNNSAYGYFLLKNNGNIKTNFKITGTGGTSDWGVHYYTAIYNGGKWETNQNITAYVTNSGFITNISPYNGISDLCVIIAKVTPSATLAENSSYLINLKVSAQAGTNYYDQDVAAMNVVIKNYKPDLQIGIITNNGVVLDYKGDNIYNSTGDYQDKFQKADTNVVSTYFITVQNDGKQDTLRVTGTGGNSSWRVKYFTDLKGGVDITSSITNGGYDFLLNDLASTQIRVEVTPINPAIGSAYNMLVNVISTNNPAEVDAVKITTRRVESKVELMVKRLNDTSYIGSNIYNTNALNQSITNIADNGMTNTFYIRVYNMGSESMNIILNGNWNKSLTSGWNVKYFNNGEDITSQITNYYILSNLAVNSYKDIEVKISPPLIFSAGANELMDAFLLGRSESAIYKVDKMDENKIFTRCISSKEDLIAVNSTNKYIGRNIINTNYNTQNSFEYINHLITNTYHIVITNNSPSAYNVKLKATELNYNNWSINFIHGGTNINSYISSGWYTPIIPAYGREIVDVIVHPLNTVIVDTTNYLMIRATSSINPSDIDVIKFSTSRITPPDLLVKKTNQIAYGGDDEYGTNIASQASGGSISTNIIIQGNTNDYWYLVKLQNDRTLPENVVLYGTGSDTNFMISYWKYIGTNINSPEYNDNSKWSNITLRMLNSSGYTLYNINGGTNILFRVGARVTNTNIREGDSIETRFKAIGLAAKYVDEVRMYTTYGIARPDLIIISNWDNVYENSNVTVQIITNIVDKATGSIINFVIQNESSLNQGTFVVKGQNDVGDWILKYYDHTSDISANVKSAAGYTKSMPVLTSSTLQMNVLVNTNSSYTNGERYTMFLSVEPEDGPNLRDMCHIVTIITDKGKVDISLTNGDWNNLYESTAVTQVYQYIYVEKGHYANFDFCIGNDRNDAEEMLRFSGDGSIGNYTINYYWWHNSVWSNVTPLCTAGGEFHPHMLNNSVITMRFQVYVNTNEIVGDTPSFKIHLLSQGKLVSDNAKLWVKVVDNGKPDLSFVSGAWDNIYENNTPVVQITNFTIEKGYTNIYYLNVGNDKSEMERLSLTGPGNKGDFTVNYFIITNNVTNNITDGVTNTGFSIPVAAGSNALLKVSLTLYSNSNYTFDSNYNLTLKLYSQAQSVNDAISIITKVTDKGIPDLGYSAVKSNYQFIGTLYPTSQQTNIYVEKGIPKYDYLVLHNGLSSRGETFRFQGEKIASAGWNLNCYDMLYNDIPYFTNNNYYYISPNSTKTMLLEMDVDEDSLVSGSRSTSFTLISRGKLKRDVLTLTYTITDRGVPDLVYANGLMGDGEYEDTYPPLSQVYTNLIEKGETYVQIIYLENDNPDRGEKLRFYGAASKGDFTVVYQYYTNATWVTIDTQRKIYVDNNSCATLKMLVTLAAASTYDTNVLYNFPLKLESLGQQHQDNMIIWYKVADKGRPNIALTNGNWTNYVEVTPIYQKTNLYVEKGYTNRIYLDLWNNRTNRSETFNLKGENLNIGDFSIKYFIITNNITNDITANVLGSGFNILVKSNDKVRMLFKTGLSLNATSSLGEISTNFIYLYSQNGFARDAIKILSIVTDYGKPDLVSDNNHFNDIYYPDTENTNVLIEKGFYFTNFIYLNNDLSSIRPGEVYTFYGGVDSGDWDIEYYYKTNSKYTNISTAVSSGREFYVPANSSITLAQVMFVDENSSYTYGTSYSISNILLSQGKLVRDMLSFVYTITSFAQPDLSLTNGLGTNIYESETVLTQNYTNIVEKGITNYITFICGNDNPIRSENLRFIGNKSTNDFYMSYYFYKNGSWTNVTTDATNQDDGFQFYVANNSIKTMKMGIYLDLKSTFNTNTFYPFNVYLKSQGKLKKDHFIITGKVVDRGKPDISFTNGVWNDLYDYVDNAAFPPSYQNTNFTVEKGYTNHIYLKIGNDRSDNHYELMHLTGMSNYNDFIIKYTILTNNEDITPFVTSSTGALLLVKAGNGNELKIKADVYLLPTSDNSLGEGVNLNLILHSMGGFYMEKASIVVSTTDRGIPDLYTDGEFNNKYYPVVQKTNIISEKGFTITNYIYLNNDLTTIRPYETYHFKTTSGRDQWNLSYYYLTNGVFQNVTAEVTNEREFYVSANSTRTLIAVMSIDTNCTYPMGTKLNTSMTLISQGLLKRDVMSFVYFITDRGIPDITLTNSGSIWSTTYEESGNVSVQIYTNEIELKKTNNFYFYLENDNNKRGEVLRFTGPGYGADYELRYYKVEGGSKIDITSQVTNEYEFYLSNNSQVTMLMECYIGSNSGVTTNQSWDINLRLLSQGRFKEDNAIIHYVVVDNGKPDIALNSGIWNNFYYPTNIQSTNFYVEPRKTNTLILQLQNDKNEGEILHLKANSIGNNLFTIQYIKISNTIATDITSYITNYNGYNISFTAESTQLLKINVVIDTNSNYAFGSNILLNIELYSEARFKKDMVTLNTYLTDLGTPDCKLSNNTFDNVYYPDTEDYKVLVERGWWITNNIIIENDNTSRDETFLLKANRPDTNNFAMNILYYTNGIFKDISFTTFSNGREILIPNNSIKTLQTRFLYKLTAITNYPLNYEEIVPVYLYSAARMKYDRISMIYTMTDSSIPDIMTINQKYSNEFYWITPNSQISNYVFEKGTSNTFVFIVKNSRSDRDEYMSVKMDNFISDGWLLSVRMQSNSSWLDITGDITNRGKYFNLPANSSSTLLCKIGVYADNTNRGAFTNKINIKLFSQSHIKYDRILLNSILSVPQPDLMVKSETGSVIGSDIYTNNLNFTNGEFVVGRAFYGYDLRFNVKLQNDNAINDTLIMYYKIPDYNGKWKFDIYELNLVAGTNTNVGLISRTTLLANTNNSGYYLAPGETKTFLVKIAMATKDIDIDEPFKILFYSKSKDNPDKVDVVGIEAIRQPVSVSGTIIYKKNRSPVVGAKFTIWDSSGKTSRTFISDAAGRVAFENLPGTYKIEIKIADYIPYTGELSIPDAPEYNFGNIEMIKYNVENDILNIHAFPNPIEEGESIRLVYNIPEQSTVTIEIYDIQGRLIKTILDEAEVSAGKYTYLWDGLNDEGKRVKRGIYFLIISTDKEEYKKKIFIK